jgi:hypothetical protein
MCFRCTDPLSERFGVHAKAPSGNHDFQAMQEAFKPALSCTCTGRMTGDHRFLTLSAVQNVKQFAIPGA